MSAADAVHKVLTERYEPGDRFPSHAKQIATTTGYSEKTVRRAFAQLLREGRLMSDGHVHGKAFFKLPNPSPLGAPDDTPDVRPTQGLKAASDVREHTDPVKARSQAEAMRDKTHKPDGEDYEIAPPPRWVFNFLGTTEPDMPEGVCEECHGFALSRHTYGKSVLCRHCVRRRLKVRELIMEDDEGIFLDDIHPRPRT